MTVIYTVGEMYLTDAQTGGLEIKNVTASELTKKLCSSMDCYIIFTQEHKAAIELLIAIQGNKEMFPPVMMFRNGKLLILGET